jgi:hypothetical protein
MTLETRCTFAEAMAAQGRGPEAEAEYQAVAAARARALGPDHPDTVDARAAVARLASWR